MDRPLVDTHFLPTFTFNNSKSFHTHIHSNQFPWIELGPYIGHQHSLPTSMMPMAWYPSSPNMHFVSYSPIMSIRPWTNIHPHQLLTTNQYQWLLATSIISTPCKGRSSSTPKAIVLLDVAMDVLQTYTLFTPTFTKEIKVLIIMVGRVVLHEA